MSETQAKVGRSVLFGLILSASTLAMAAGRGKIVALMLGPEGVGDMGMALQIARVAMVPAAMVVGPALLRQMAIAHAQGDPAQKTRLLSESATLAIAVVLLAIPLAGAIGAWTDPSLPLALVLGAAAARGTMNWAYFGRQILVSVKQLRAVAGIGVLLATAVLAGAAAGAAVDGLRGVFVGMTAGSLLTLPAYAVVFRWSGFQLVALRPAFSWPFFKETAILGTASLAAAGFGQGALLAIRTGLDRVGGAELNGLFEAAWSISAGNLNFVVQGLGVVLLPRFAVAATPDALKIEVEAATRFLLSLAVPGLCLALALKRVAIVVLYSADFLAIDQALGWMIVAAVATLVSWSQGTPLLYQRRVRAFVVNQAIAAFTLVVLGLVLVPRYGLEGAAAAWLWTYLQHVVVTGLTLKWACGVDLRPLLYLRTMALCLAGLVLVWLLPRIPGGEPLLAAIGLLLAWRSEAVGEMLTVVRRKLQGPR